LFGNGRGREQARACESRPRPGARRVRVAVSVMGAGLALPRREPDAPSPSGGGVTGPPSPIGAHSSACTLGDEYRDVNSFTLLDVLGVGAMGKVRLVRHKRTGLHFALKAVAKDTVTRRGTRAARLVIAERDALSALERSPHDRVARMFAHFQDATSLYILLEYVPGGELRSKMRRHGRFSEQVTRFFVAAIATAVDHLHAVVGVAHRDLKPENVLLDNKGYPKLCDLGSCTRLSDGGSNDDAGSNPRRGGRSYTAVGTPEYLAPEVIDPAGGRLDLSPPMSRVGYDARAVDWWALGVLAFELMHGRPPFRARNVHALYRAIAAGDARYSKRCTGEFVDVVGERGFTARDPSKRLGVRGVRGPRRVLRALGDVPGWAFGFVVVGGGGTRGGGGSSAMRSIKRRAWFSGFDWDGLEKGRIRAPVPVRLPDGDGDASNYRDVRERGWDGVGCDVRAAPAPPSSPSLRSVERGDRVAADRSFDDW